MTNAAKAFGIIVDSMYAYVRTYPASAKRKQELYAQLHKLCADIGRANNISDWKAIIENSTAAPIKNDIDIELIKALHNREGYTKKQLQDLLHASDRTTQKNIHRLNGDAKNHLIPICVAAVIVPDEILNKDDLGHSDRHRFFTPNSMSPVIYQPHRRSDRPPRTSFHDRASTKENKNRYHLLASASLTQSS